MSSVNDSKKSLESVDFFKGIAILMVIFVHSVQRFNVPYWFGILPSIGQLGCQIFFVLSGFSLCLAYAEKKINYFSFVKRRISKLVVGFWTMIVFYSFVNIVFALRDGIPFLQALNLRGIVLNFLFLHGFSPDKADVNGIVRGGWFVGSVVILYLIFPFLIKLFNVNNSTWRKIRVLAFPLITYVISCVVFCLCALINEDYSFENNSVSYFSWLNQLPCFSLGFSLYEIRRNNIGDRIKFSYFKFLCFAILSLLMFFSKEKNVLIFMSFFVALSFFYIYIASENTIYIHRIIESKTNKVSLFVKKCGKNSFAIYLTHPIIVHLLIKPVLEQLIKIYDNNMIWYIVSVPFMFAMSYYIAKAFTFYTSIIGKIICFIKKTLNKQKAN